MDPLFGGAIALIAAALAAPSAFQAIMGKSVMDWVREKRSIRPVQSGSTVDLQKAIEKDRRSESAADNQQTSFALDLEPDTIVIPDDLATLEKTTVSLRFINNGSDTLMIYQIQVGIPFVVLPESLAPSGPIRTTGPVRVVAGTVDANWRQWIEAGEPRWMLTFMSNGQVPSLPGVPLILCQLDLPIGDILPQRGAHELTYSIATHMGHAATGALDLLVVQQQSGHLAIVSPSEFRRADFQLSSTGFERTSFELSFRYAGDGARAEAGATAKGENLVVRFQDEEIMNGGMGIWLTVENRGERWLRWFGPELVAYGDPSYLTLDPQLHQSGGHLIFDIYPGEQFTCFYLFAVDATKNSPKFISCKSHDVPISFEWAHGV